MGYSLIFFAAWVNASNNILNRELKNVHHAIMMFWHGVFGIMISIAVVLVEAWVNGNGLRMFNYEAKIYNLMLGATIFNCL